MTWEEVTDGDNGLSVKEENADYASSRGEQSLQDFYGANIGGDFLNNLYFYSNILWYLIYCSYISAVRFSAEDFSKTRDYCVEGAYYEVQYATQLV